MLSWVTRIVRVKDSVLDPFGPWAPRMRVFRTSNGYQLTDPLALRGYAYLRRHTGPQVSGGRCSLVPARFPIAAVASASSGGSGAHKQSPVTNVAQLAMGRFPDGLAESRAAKKKVRRSAGPRQQATKASGGCDEDSVAFDAM